MLCLLSREPVKEHSQTPRPCYAAFPTSEAPPGSRADVGAHPVRCRAGDVGLRALADSSVSVLPSRRARSHSAPCSGSPRSPLTWKRGEERADEQEKERKREANGPEGY